jgi:cobalamin biosynthesis Co2+ chelatase CbiK
MSGEDEDSWESKLNARGMRTEVRLKGLGEYEGIRELICEHAHDALMMREVALRG